MNIFKKTFGVCLIGFGCGTLLGLLLPISGWVFRHRGNYFNFRFDMALQVNKKGNDEYEDCCI